MRSASEELCPLSPFSRPSGNPPRGVPGKGCGQRAVHSPPAEASSAQPFAPRPEGSELPANPLSCGCTCFAQVTTEGRGPDAAGLFPRNSLENWNTDSAENRKVRSVERWQWLMRRRGRRAVLPRFPRGGPRFPGLHPP